MVDYTENWEKTKKRFEAFWQGEILDRCMVAVFAPKPNASLKTFEFPEGEEDRKKCWTDGEYILNRKLNYFENTYFGGDAFPQIMLDLGTAGHAGFFKGSRYEFEKKTIWFSPVIDDIETFNLEFDETTFLYKKTIELAEYLVNESKGRYFVSMPDVSGNLDALAHLRGTENLLVDILTEEDWVLNSLEKIQASWKASLEKVFDIVIKNNENGSTIGWLNTWAEGRHSQMQCDISVMISAEMFQKYVMDELRAQCNYLDKSLYHFDGIEQIRHLDMMLSIDKLDAIQWTCVAGQPSPVEFLPALKKIQSAGKKLVIPFRENFSIKDFEILLRELSSKGLMIITSAASKEEADHLIKIAEKLTHE